MVADATTYYRHAGSSRVFLIARGAGLMCAETGANALDLAVPLDLSTLPPERQRALGRQAAQADRLVLDDEVAAA